MATAAFVLKQQIQVFQDTNRSFQIYDIYPRKHFDKCDPIRVVYKPDSTNNPGHFDVLMDSLEIAKLSSYRPTDLEHVSFDNWISFHTGQRNNIAESEDVSFLTCLFDEALSSGSDEKSHESPVQVR